MLNGEVYDTAQQKNFGIIVINIDFMKYLEEILRKDVHFHNIYIYNEHGDLFFLNVSENTMKFYHRDDLVFVSEKNGLSTLEFIDFLKNDPKKVAISRSIYSDFNKKNYALTLLISASKTDLYKDDFSRLFDFVLVIVIVSVFGAIFIFIFTRKFLMHLSDMANYFESQSRKSYDFPTNLNDEVGVLARALQKKTEQLTVLALYDSLTGLPNRKSFIDHLDEAILRAKRNSDSLAVMFIDINDFKKVNDNYGHSYGDELLIQFSKELVNVGRETDFCARLAGDEFAVVLENINTDNDIEVVTQRYRDGLNKIFIIKGITFHLTVSGGIALYPEDGKTSNELLMVSDRAMYYSKNSREGDIVRTN